MVRIREEGYFSKALKKIFFLLWTRLENNNNADFFANGESRFLKEMCQAYLGKKMIIFDIGANVGGYTDILIKYCKKYRVAYEIHLFEPTSKSFSVVKEKFSADTQVKLNNFGVSDKDEETIIYFDKEGSSLASLYQRDLKNFNITMSREEKIVLKRLDDYIEENKIKQVDFMKLDVEGHEVAALNGLGKYLNPSLVKAIQFEYGGANIDSRTFLKDLYKLLEKKGFDVCKITRRGLVRKKYVPNLENFQYSNYVALNLEVDG